MNQSYNHTASRLIWACITPGPLPTTPVQLAGQNETCTSMLTVPATYLDSACIQPIGILLAHGLEAGDWDSPLMRGLVNRFAGAGHIVMRYHCRQKEARRQRILERALESAALSPLALATVQQWVVVGFDNGARVAASVAAKTRIRIGGYVALSYPLLVRRLGGRLQREGRQAAVCVVPRCRSASGLIAPVLPQLVLRALCWHSMGTSDPRLLPWRPP